MEDLRPLNNCEVFNQIRIEFTNYHQHTKKLNSFLYFGGNEQHIKNLSQRLLNVLLEHGLVQQDEEDEDAIAVPAAGADLDQLRGALMYLVLNSANVDGSIEKGDLGRCNPQCVHLLQQLPAPLPQLVTVSVALQCGLHQQLLELIACSPHWLASQYFDCLNDTLAHQVLRTKRHTLPLICGALSAVTKSICYGNASNAFLMDNAMRMLQRNLLDTEERQQSLGSRAARNRYLGEAMRQLLDVLLELMHALDGSKLLLLPDYAPVYALRSPTKCKLESNIKVEATTSDDKLRLFAGKLMDWVQRLLVCISVDTYMAWQELDSGQLLFHLQAHISNQCGELVPLLVEDETLKTHCLRSMLDNFTQGAQSFEQRLQMLTLGELLGFLDGEMGDVSTEQLHAALNELLQRSICFGNDECVESMAKHVKLLTSSHAKLILDHLSEVLLVQAQQRQLADFEEDELDDNNEIYGKLLSQVLMPIYMACSDPMEKLQLLCYRDKLQLLEHYNFEEEDHHSRRIYFFNQLSDSIEQFPLHTFLDLCWEQPAQTWLSLAQLAMIHGAYAHLYWHVASVQCAPHAVHHVPFTVQQLMQDERLLSQKTDFDLLLALYEHPVILNGMQYRRLHRQRQLTLNLNVSAVPYSDTELQSAQSNYLSACANGLAKCSKSNNYVAMEKLMQTLLRLPQVEQRLIKCSRKCLQWQRHRLSQLLKGAASTAKEDELKQTRGKIRLARTYVTLHGKLCMWRLSSWPLISQLILCMDRLRPQLDTFEPARLAVLDLVMKSYIKNMPLSFLHYPDLVGKVRDLVTKSLQHKHLWQDEHLALLLDTHKPPQAKECATLLAQASSVEAIKLLGNATRHGIDRVVMEQLAQAVDLIDSPNSLNAYAFLFKCYMHAFEQWLIKPSKSDNYPSLIEHLLQAPKLQMTQNLLAAIDNFKILLKPSCGLMDKSKILEYVAKSLTTLNISIEIDNIYMEHVMNM
ncbi:uncharacterized protein LOC6560405 [Drosophila grimshawi]|uniref:GH21356 n=1 Tax=Drosophila grimshawi TaxID=7222 RepID=B4J8M0_DROGR|nr:uncharacterized protein LOC6560405 [Drosophila grimshawi]EDW01287.1 GH21356 [Drosophila grimshawi]